MPTECLLLWMMLLQQLEQCLREAIYLKNSCQTSSWNILSVCGFSSNVNSYAHGQDWFCRHKCQYHMMSITFGNSLYLYCMLNIVYVSPRTNTWFTSWGASAVCSKLLINQELFHCKDLQEDRRQPSGDPSEPVWLCHCPSVWDITTPINSLAWKTLWLVKAAQCAASLAKWHFWELILGHLKIMPCQEIDESLALCTFSCLWKASLSHIVMTSTNSVFTDLISNSR